MKTFESHRQSALRGAFAAFVCASLCLLGVRTAYAGDPTRQWMTIETPHFVIHYYQPLDAAARRVGEVAERAHKTLSVALDHEPTVKTVIILLDDTDGANGFANVLPNNSITLYATTPTGDSILNDHDDWLYTLVAHEYTHILHLDTMSGLPRIYNAIFGKTWAPNQVLPRWIIEGIATYEETKRSAGGRARNSIFDMYLRVPVLAGKAFSIDVFTGLPREFPQGNAAYLYGSKFLRYIFDRYGDDKLRQMSHFSGAHAIPFAINRQIERVVGRTFDSLEGDWDRFMLDDYSLQLEAVERAGQREGRQITHSAASNLAPHYSHDGKELMWLQSDGYTRTRIRALPVGGDFSQARDLVKIDALGAWSMLHDNSLVYEQTRAYRRDYEFQDLFHWDNRTGRTERLTTGARARDPSVSFDERQVAFSMNGGSRSSIAVMPLEPGGKVHIAWQGPGHFDQAYEPEWSHDGKMIAFSAWQTGGYRDILLLDVATGKTTELTHDRAIDDSPAWSWDDRYIYFGSDRTGISNIYAYDRQTNQTWQVTNVVGGAYEPAVSPDNKHLAYHGFVVGGFDLFELENDPSRWVPATPFIDDRPPPTTIHDDEVPVSEPRKYRAMESIAPRTWTLQAALGTITSGATLQTGGTDSAGLHGYSLAVALDFNRGDVDFGGAYSYSGLRTGLNVSGSRSVINRGGFNIDGHGRNYLEEDWSSTVSVSLPTESRPETNWSLSFDYDINYFRQLTTPYKGADPNQPVPSFPDTNYAEAGVATRFGFSSVRATGFSLGPNDGFDISASSRLDLPTLGSKYRIITLSFAADGFWRLPWGRTPTLAVRVAGAIRRGDQDPGAVYSLGGIPPQNVSQSIVDNARAGSIGYLRGYAPRTVTGSQFYLANVEYRHELGNIERGLSTLPVYLKRVHMAGLFDAGTAFNETFTEKQLRMSAGVALRLDVLLGYFIPGTFEIGVSHGLTSQGIYEEWLLLTGTL